MLKAKANHMGKQVVKAELVYALQAVKEKQKVRLDNQMGKKAAEAEPTLQAVKVQAKITEEERQVRILELEILRRDKGLDSKVKKPAKREEVKKACAGKENKEAARYVDMTPGDDVFGTIYVKEKM